jgi:hypothetical protein
LVFKYDVDGAGAFNDLSFTWNIDNVLNQDPPKFLRQDITIARDGYISRDTAGHVFLSERCQLPLEQPGRGCLVDIRS